MLQCAGVFVTEIPNYVRKNLRLTCDGKNIHYDFVSGKNPTNEYVIQHDEHDKIPKKWWKRGRRLRTSKTFSSLCCSLWEGIKDICGTLGGVARGGLTGSPQLKLTGVRRS